MERACTVKLSPVDKDEEDIRKTAHGIKLTVVKETKSVLVSGFAADSPNNVSLYVGDVITKYHIVARPTQDCTGVLQMFACRSEKAGRR